MMTSLAFHGTHCSSLTTRFRWWRGITPTTMGMSPSSFHSLVVTVAPRLAPLNRAAASSNLLSRHHVSSFYFSRWSNLPQYRSSSIVKGHRLRITAIETPPISSHSMNRLAQKNSHIARSERVYTSVTKRHQHPMKSHRSTATLPPVYTIPTTTLIRSKNAMIRSPYTMLSPAQYFSDGGGPSRFPQVNPPNRNSTTNRWAQGVGLLGAASVVFGKTKYVLAALKVTKLASLGSMVLSIGAYSMLFGWPYAIGVVGLIFCHECGHLAVMLHRGIPFSPMVFIPFMGAVISMKDQPRDAWEDALIAAGGPYAGTMASCAVAVAANVTNSQILYALADFGYMINLINLLPIGSMDGGRWVGALSKYVGACGTAFGGYLAWTGAFSNPLFYLIVLAGAYETFWRFYDPYHLPPNFYKISNTQRAILTGGYFGLIAFLLTAMAANQRRQKPPEVIAREQGAEPFWDSSSF